jgi:hypothetical protein
MQKKKGIAKRTSWKIKEKERLFSHCGVWNIPPFPTTTPAGP